MNNEQPIGVFDSGIGGMTVVRALLQELPHENIVYFGDTARVPYGPKSPQVVREYALQDTEILLQHNVKIIVVACNTVSAVALDVVQKRAKIPVIGVILPGAEAAVTDFEEKTNWHYRNCRHNRKQRLYNCYSSYRCRHQSFWTIMSIVCSVSRRRLDQSQSNRTHCKRISLSVGSGKNRYAGARLYLITRSFRLRLQRLFHPM